MEATIFTEVQYNELRARNEERLVEAKEKLGTKYLLHPNNQVKRLVPFKKARKNAKNIMR
jgi:hypothetical protein